MQKKLRKIMVILLSLVFVISGASIGNAALGTTVALNTNQITENVPIGSVVANPSVLNPTSGDTYTYALVNGIGDKDNDSFEIVNIPYAAIPSLKTKTAIDYETQNKYSIRIKATDNHGASYTKKFELTVVNVNDAPTAYDKTYTTKTGAAISGTLSVNDFESNTLWYSLAGTPNASVAATTYGTVQITNVNTGAFTYTPTTTYTGALTDSFKFSVFDGVYTSNIATATIKINKEEIVTSDLSLSIRPGTINLNSASNKTPILAVIKLGTKYNIDNLNLDSLTIKADGILLKNTKKQPRVYGNSEDGYYVKAMFYRSDLLKLADELELEDKDEITITASLGLKNSTAKIEASDDVKIKLPKSMKEIKKNNDKKDKNDKIKHNDDDDEEDDD